MKIINTYGCSSRQQLIVDKSSILFGNKVPPDIKTEIKQVLGIVKEGGMGVYQKKICGSKKQVFAFIQERLHDRINSWSAKLLSKGGKEVLIKSVAQALPTYVMSCLLLPQEIIRKLTSAISRFWWSTKNNNRGLHWIAWKKICTPKESSTSGKPVMIKILTARIPPHSRLFNLPKLRLRAGALHKFVTDPIKKMKALITRHSPPPKEPAQYVPLTLPGIKKITTLVEGWSWQQRMGWRLTVHSLVTKF